MNPNKFAAIPSLHAAFPALILFFAVRRFGRRGWPVALFPAGVFFSAVYLNHHYIIDLLLAILYVAVALVLEERLFYPLLVERRNPLRRPPAGGARAPGSRAAGAAGGARVGSLRGTPDQRRGNRTAMVADQKSGSTLSNFMSSTVCSKRSSSRAW
jgi:hypothetical protein